METYKYFGKNIPLKAFLGEERYKLFCEMKRNLELYDNQKYIILSGAYMGKTVFLEILKEYLDGIIVYIDAGILNSITCKSFFECILESISKAINVDKKDYKLGENFNYTDFQGKFLSLKDRGRKKIILLFDQVKFLYEAELLREFFRNLCSFVNEKFSAVFTGFKDIHQFYLPPPGGASPWTKKRMRCFYGLSKADCKELLLNLELDSNKTDELYEDSGGHPYILHRSLESYINEIPLSDVKNDFEKNLFIRWYDKLNDEEKLIYEELFSNSRSLEYIRNLFPEKNYSYINKCIENLRYMNLITTSNKEIYFIIGDLFKEWYEKNFSPSSPPPPPPLPPQEQPTFHNITPVSLVEDKIYYKSVNSKISKTTREEAEEIIKTSKYEVIVDMIFNKCIYCNGKKLEVSNLPFNTLSYLAFNFGMSKSLSDIAIDVWSEVIEDYAKVRNCITKLNKHANFIINTSSFNYKFNEDISVCILYVNDKKNIYR